MKHITIVFLTGIILFLLTGNTLAQTTVAFQGGEGTFADNWGYTAITNAGGALSPGNVTTYPRTGSYSIRAGGGNTIGCSSGVNCIVGGGAVGCPMHGKTILFNPVNVACLPDVQLSVYHRSHVFCTGNGFDSGENLYFEIRLNGGSWVLADTVGGFNEYTWNYATSPAGSTFKTPNPFVYNVPAGTTIFEFRVRTNTNRGDEVYYIDDVKLTTTSTAYGFPGTAGLWHGEVNTDWNNSCNWNNRILPTAVTDVLIPNSATNICEIFASASGTCRDLIIDKSRLAVENVNSTLNVNGNLTIETNGELDLSLNPIQGGFLNLSGNWLNKRDEFAFGEGGSTVTFNGNSTQTVSVTNDTKEAYYKINLNKSGGSVLTSDDIWVDKNFNGGATTMLNILNGTLDLNAKELLVWNENPIAIQRIGGGIISERTDNFSRVTWKTGSSLGVFTFPFINVSGNYVPLVIETISGSSTQITAATYATPPNNLPWPVTPVSVLNLTSAIGLTPDNRDATVDRFWQIDIPGSTTANLTFNYALAELPAAPYNNPAGIKAQRYEGGSGIWQPYLPGQSAGTYFATVPLVSNFSTWTLTNEVAPLPIELLTFSAGLNSENSVDLLWITASEINNDYFTLQKSKDGASFKSFKIIKGAGNSGSLLHYQFTDENPFNEITYYRLKQTDYDGLFSYSGIIPVRMKKEPAHNYLIFPNPAQDFFYVQFDGEMIEQKLFITEMNGKFICELSMMNGEIISEGLIKISTRHLPAGMYLVASSSGGFQKLVVQ